MASLSPTAKANLAVLLGADIKALNKKCNEVTAKMLDAAESEKSRPLRQCLYQIAEQIENLTNTLNAALEPDT